MAQDQIEEATVPSRRRGGETMLRKMYSGGTALALVVAVATPGHAQETHRVSGSEIAVYNLAGEARVVRGSGSDVVVRITRGGADAARLDVQTGEVDGRETLRVIYPDDQIVYPGLGRGSRTSLRVREDGTFGESGRSGERIDIRGSGRGLEAWADLVVEVPDGKDFTLHVAAGKMDVQGVHGDVHLKTGSGSVDASDVVGSLDVDTGSGSVSVRGIQGDLGVDTGSGSVSLRGVTGGHMEIDTGSGGVRGGGLSGPSLSVDTGSGSIELDDVSVPDVVLDTGSGGVELGLLVDVDRLDVDTGSGSVTIHAPEDLGAEVELETGSGGIDLDFALQVRSVRRDHVYGTLGDGKGRIHIDTGSGSVRLLKN
jgi:DUF4097 and DUF4098 domain-containing protein YvlB